MHRRIPEVFILATAFLTLRCGIFEPREGAGSITIRLPLESGTVSADVLSEARYVLKSGTSTVREGRLSVSGGFFEVTISKLEPGDYQVEVFGLDGDGDPVASGAGSITVRAGAKYIRVLSWNSLLPELLYPLDDAPGASVTPVLMWNPVPVADSYSVQLSADPDFNGIVYDQSGLEAAECPIMRLSHAVRYYWRVNAQVNGETGGWSETRTFTTGAAMDPVTDIDGNGYSAVVIGRQAWTVENLRVTRYRNGDPIPNLPDATDWKNATAGAYCVHFNKTDSVETFGCYYNWYAVADPRNLAPQGWRVPTEEDWQTLVEYLGGGATAGVRMRAAERWNCPGDIAVNESGFSALPWGKRFGDGSFYIFSDAGFWSATPVDSGNANFLFLNCGAVPYLPYDTNNFGYAVRLVRNQ